MEPEILYALTDEGMRLPVVDVTNPAFTVRETDAELAAMSDQFLRDAKRWQQMPATVLAAIQESVLGRGLTAASGTFLTGLATYLLKLGPDHLWADASQIDRAISASLPALAIRVRLQDMARLVADGLSEVIAPAPTRPICLVNIAGGPAADSWNALIYLRREHPDLLADRQIVVAVLDPDEHGPSFGARVFESLVHEGAPLGGLEIDVRRVAYDWSHTDRLGSALEDLHAHRAACAISSEGGLFEYGSDAEIVANLEGVRAGTPPDAFVVGSVTRKGDLVEAQRPNRAATRPRTLEEFRSLVEQGGWVVQRVINRPFSYNVRLVKQVE